MKVFKRLAPRLKIKRARLAPRPEEMKEIIRQRTRRRLLGRSEHPDDYDPMRYGEKKIRLPTEEENQIASSIIIKKMRETFGDNYPYKDGKFVIKRIMV